MLKTVSNLKDSVAGILSGTNLNNAHNLYGAFERTAREFIQKADVPEAGGNYPITLYSGVFDYSITDTIFGAYLLDFRQVGLGRGENDYVYRTGIERFDRTKKTLPNGYQVTFEFDNGTPIIRVATPKPLPKVILDAGSSTNWTKSGSAGTLSTDSAVYYDNNNSVRFTLTGASSGYLTKTLTSTNLSIYENVGVIFIPIWTPSASNLTSVDIRIGSSSSNYYSLSKTSGFLGSWTANDWTLLAFDLSQASTTGTPNFSAVTYLRVGVTHAATLTNFRVGGVWLSYPSPHELVYQSAAIFLPSEGTSTLQTITDDNDTIILTDAALVIYEYECAKTIAEQMGAEKNSGRIQGLDSKLTELYKVYISDNPSQSIRLIGSYYDAG